MLTHLRPTPRTPGSSSYMVSINKKGYLWGMISMISFAVYNDITFVSLMESYSYRPIKILALCPPKPSELLRA